MGMEKRGTAAVAMEMERSRSEDGEEREVKKAKVGDSSPPIVVSGDIIPPAVSSSPPFVVSGDIIPPAVSRSPPIVVSGDIIPPAVSSSPPFVVSGDIIPPAVDGSRYLFPVIYVQFLHCTWKDASDEILFPFFSQFGEIIHTFRVYTRDDFIYIPYMTRDGVTKAVQEPLKKLQSLGQLICTDNPCALLHAIRQTVLDKVKPLLVQLHHHPANTKVYVCNVIYETDPDALKALFSQFGEIAAGPLLFQLDADWETVHYLIVYKTEEGANEALKQPYKQFGGDKQFGGHQLHCTSDLEDVVKTAQKDVLQQIQTNLGNVTSTVLCELREDHDAAKTKPQLLQQQDSKPSLAYAIDDVTAAARRFKTAADLAVAAAERLNHAADLISTQLQGSMDSP